MLEAFSWAYVSVGVGKCSTLVHAWCICASESQTSPIPAHNTMPAERACRTPAGIYSFATCVTRPDQSVGVVLRVPARAHTHMVDFIWVAWVLLMFAHVTLRDGDGAQTKQNITIPHPIDATARTQRIYYVINDGEWQFVVVGCLYVCVFCLMWMGWCEESPARERRIRFMFLFVLSVINGQQLCVYRANG